MRLKPRQVTVALRSNAWDSSVPREISGMKSLSHSGNILTKHSISTALIALFLFSASLSHASDHSGFQVNPGDQPDDVIVHGQLRGWIFGLEVHPDGTEVLLCDALPHPDGTWSARG